MSTPEIWTVLKLLTWTKGYLAEKGVENARLEAEWLLASALDLDRVGLYVNYDKPLSPAELTLFRGMVARRGRREPLQYILGTQEFMGLEFKVAPGVLIPRHDTETLVNEAMKNSPNARRVLDIGTGSGCIAVALAKGLPAAEVVAVEESAAALAIATENCSAHAVAVTLREGSLFEPCAGETFDLIVSNPPYIPTAEVEQLQPEVREFEPRGALDGGEDGLEFYRAIVPVAPRFLNPGGCFFLEVGMGQAPAVREMLAATGEFTDLVTARDPGDIERVVGGRKSG